MENERKNNFFVFIGRSGSGKGTQAELLKSYLEDRDSTHPVIWFGSGKRFREFIKKDGYTQSLAHEVYESGGLQPAFLAVHIWAHFFIETLKGNETVFLDGTPRKLDEARILDGALEFYKGEVTVVFVNVSREWAMERLLGRGREDDTERDIEKRLDWFDSEVEPTVEFYRNHTSHTFVEINGEQTIEEVHREIIKSLKA